MKALWIDATNQEVKVVDYDGLKGMQELVGGSISHCFTFPNGDDIYVDDEGLLKQPEHFFWFAGRLDQPFAGNAIVVGAERYDDKGDYTGTGDPITSVEALRKLVRFANWVEVRAWAVTNVDTPSATFSYVDKDGTVHTEVLSTFGELFGDRLADDDDD